MVMLSNAIEMTVKDNMPFWDLADSVPSMTPVFQFGASPWTDGFDWKPPSFGGRVELDFV